MIGRHYSASPTGISAVSKQCVHSGRYVYQCDAGKPGLEAELIYNNFKLWPIIRSTRTSNLACIDRDGLITARKYTVGLLEFAKKTNFRVVVLYPGACPEEKGNGRRRLISSLRSICAATDSDVKIAIENDARGGSISAILEAIELTDDPRLCLSLNLGNAWASGYLPEDLENPTFASKVEIVQFNIPGKTSLCGGEKMSSSVISESIWPESTMSELLKSWRDTPIIARTPDSTEFWRLVALAGTDQTGAVNEQVAASNP